LRVQDLGEDCLYVRHSWNCRDRLKTTKNNECRTVEVPFPGVIHDFLTLAGYNSHGAGMDSYVFWAEKSPEKPMDGILFVRGLHDALEKTGMSREAANAYVFHGWRHFFTAYMRDKLNEKLLQSQTGHKTIPMLNHYADHLLVGDRERIRQAQRDAFGALEMYMKKYTDLETVKGIDRGAIKKYEYLDWHKGREAGEGVEVQHGVESWKSGSPIRV
jgi:hypothetical protein